MSQMFKTPFGSAQRKLVAVRLADYADDDGRGIWPAVATIATECDLSERTVQRTLSDFVEEGILTLVAEGGGRKTNRYDFDLAVIHALKTGEKTRGDTVSPVTGCHPWGDTVSPQGCHGVTQTFNEPSNNLSSGAQERDERGDENSDLEKEEVLDGDKPSEDVAAIDRAFWAFVKDWPGFAGMPKEAARKAWQRASAEDRATAVAKRDLWLALLKRQGKSHVPAPSTYLGERLFADVPEPDAPAARLSEPPFGPAWCAERMARISAVRPVVWQPKAYQRQMLADGKIDEAAETRAANLAARAWALGLMDEQAAKGNGAACTPESIAAGKAYGKVERDSALWHAWQAAFAAQGWPWLPDMGKHWGAYFPAEGPDGFFNSAKDGA